MFHVHCMYILIIVILHHIYTLYLIFISPYFLGKKCFSKSTSVFYYSSYSIIKHAYTYISSFQVQNPNDEKLDTQYQIFLLLKVVQFYMYLSKTLFFLFSSQNLREATHSEYNEQCNCQTRTNGNVQMPSGYVLYRCIYRMVS